MTSKSAPENSALLEARRQLAQGRSYIASQERNLQELKLLGQNTGKAEAVLQTMLESQEEEHLRLVKLASRIVTPL